MLFKKRKSSSLLGKPAPASTSIGVPSSSCNNNHSGDTAALRTVTPTTSRGRIPPISSGMMIQRVPVMNGLSCGLSKPFQRPKKVGPSSGYATRRRQSPTTENAYEKDANRALKVASLGPRRTSNGMAGILARAGKGLLFSGGRLVRKNNDDGSDSDNDEKEDDQRPFDPLLVWKSPHPKVKKPKEEGEEVDDEEEEDDDEVVVEARGLPPRLVKQTRTDEFGIEETVTILQPAPIQAYAKQDVFVPPILAKWLRPHQREGVLFMYQCVMGLKDPTVFSGNGCILADDMGLGKTLQSVCLIYTLLKTGITAPGRKNPTVSPPTAKRIIVVCPCSLVKNWDNEFVKWLGPNAVKTLALAEGDRKSVEQNLDCFVKTNLFQILICSYECLRTHVGRLTKYDHCCDLLVCDEAHRLKNNENQTSRALNSLPVKRRVLLTGTPMQNDLQEFYAMVDFTNPGILGTQEEFRRKFLFPILRGREPDATDSQKRKMMELQNEMSTTVNEFILRRINTLNAQHLPPKLVQVVCCNLTEIQQNMYQHLVDSKDLHHVMEGKQVNCLGSIQMLMKLCNHPSLIVNDDGGGGGRRGGRAATKKTIKYTDGDEPGAAAPGADGVAKFMPASHSGNGRGGGPVHPQWSGKMFVLFRLMKEMRRPGNGADKIVIVSNYTQTLDLIGKMCRENSWGFCRLDGSISMKKRQKMVDEFNDPSSSLIAFLLSSKAGGCGLNLIGGNRLVLFDPDWNPAVDKQAAARCWRDGQRKRCFTYRFLATGTVEEKIFQRQLSKEGLQSVVDDKEQVNELSTKDLRNLFKLRTNTPSDTHDKLKCERCGIIHDNAEMEAKEVLPKQLGECRKLLEKLMAQDSEQYFHKPLVSADHDISKEDYEKIIKQPMDFGTIRTRLDLPPENTNAYQNVSRFSRDVRRVMENVLRVWRDSQPIAESAVRLQDWWSEQWTLVAPQVMCMKPDEDLATTACKEADTEGEPPILGINNERTDNYQEQIGMPDEENMRHWSHHYTTDSTDDPVFRAAMRGTDAVSFVFGLEVTWSLIQQRQQEEEERQALKELECIEELEDDNEEEEGNVVIEDDEEDEGTGDFIVPDGEGVSSSDDDGNSQASEPPLPMDEDEENDRVLEPETPVLEEDSDESSKGDDEQSLKDKTVDATQEAEVLLSAHSPEPKVKATQEAEVVDTPSTSASSDVLTASPVSLPSPVSEKENASPPPPSLNTWQCESCTYINAKSRKKCEICSSSRPKRQRANP